MKEVRFRTQTEPTLYDLRNSVLLDMSSHVIVSDQRIQSSDLTALSNAKGTAHKSSLQEDDLGDIEEFDYESTPNDSTKSQD